MTDWPSLISALLASGLTRPELASAVSAGVSTINELARGDTHEPRHALGERLLALYAKRCQNARRKAGGAKRKRTA